MVLSGIVSPFYIQKKKKKTTQKTLFPNYTCKNSIPVKDCKTT